MPFAILVLATGVNPNSPLKRTMSLAAPEASSDEPGDGYVRLTDTRRLVGLQMDAKEFFDRIVTPNYRDAVNNPRDLRLTYNAVITMNTAAEFLALHQLGYPEKLTAEALDKKANAIRDQHELLKQLKYHAEKMKHVRKLRRRDKTVSLTHSSTAFSPTDPTSWEYLLPVLRDAMSVLRTLIK